MGGVMKIIKLIQQAIYNFKNPSDQKLFRKAYKLYDFYASYHTLQHTRSGYLEAVERKQSMFARLEAIRDMDANDARTQEIKDTIIEFKKFNKIPFC